METRYHPSRAKTADKNTPLFMKSLCSLALVRLVPKPLAGSAGVLISAWPGVLRAVRSRGASDMRGGKCGAPTNRVLEEELKKL